jgi:hypothetical protein
MKMLLRRYDDRRKQDQLGTMDPGSKWAKGLLVTAISELVGGLS